MNKVWDYRNGRYSLNDEDVCPSCGDCKNVSDSIFISKEIIRILNGLEMDMNGNPDGIIIARETYEELRDRLKWYDQCSEDCKEAKKDE